MYGTIFQLDQRQVHDKNSEQDKTRATPAG